MDKPIVSGETIMQILFYLCAFGISSALTIGKMTKRNEGKTL